MRYATLTLLILALAQWGCVSKESKNFHPIAFTQRGIDFNERLKREVLQLEDLTIGKGPIAAAGRRVVAKITVRYRDDTLVYRGPMVTYWGTMEAVWIENGSLEPSLLSLDQTGIAVGLNGMAVGGKRRIIVPPNLVCYSGSVGDSLDKGEDPGRYCGLILPYEFKGGAATFKKTLIVEATLTASCRPVFPQIGPFYIGERCRDSDNPVRYPSDRIWRFYHAPPTKP